MKVTDLQSKPVIEGVYDPHIFKAIFTAGAPGSGKSTVVSKLTAGTGLRTIDIDKFWDLFKRKGAAGTSEVDYENYWKLAYKQKMNYVNGRLGLVIDGTARVVSRVQAIKDRLDEMGYDSLMIFVNTDLQTAIHRAQERGKITGRVMSADFVTNYYNQIQTNLGAIQTMFEGKFIIIDNSEHQSPKLEYAEKAVRAFLNAPIQNEIAHQWMDAEKEARRKNTTSLDRRSSEI